MAGIKRHPSGPHFKGLSMQARLHPKRKEILEKTYPSDERLAQRRAYNAGKQMLIDTLRRERGE